MPTSYMVLALAIVCEVIATSALQASAQFSKLIPSVICVTGYGLSFLFMSYALKELPVGIVYAIWAGLGVVLIALIGVVVFGQTLDLAACLGMALIILGVVVIHLGSNSLNH